MVNLRDPAIQSIKVVLYVGQDSICFHRRDRMPPSQASMLGVVYIHGDGSHAEEAGTCEPDPGEVLAAVAGEYLCHAVIASGIESIGSSQLLEQSMNSHVSK